MTVDFQVRSLWITCWGGSALSRFAFPVNGSEVRVSKFRVPGSEFWIAKILFILI
jgi:hypothetical protein